MFDRHLTLAVWSQPSATLILRISVTASDVPSFEFLKEIIGSPVLTPKVLLALVHATRDVEILLVVTNHHLVVLVVLTPAVTDVRPSWFRVPAVGIALVPAVDCALRPAVGCALVFSHSPPRTVRGWVLLHCVEEALLHHRKESCVEAFVCFFHACVCEALGFVLSCIGQLSSWQSRGFRFASVWSSCVRRQGSPPCWSISLEGLYCNGRSALLGFLRSCTVAPSRAEN